MSLHDAIAETLLEMRTDAVVATDRDGAVTFWGGGAERIFGFGADETLGRPMDMIVPEPLRERHWRGYRRVIETGESRYGDDDIMSVPALTKDGRRISVEFSLALLRDADGAVAGTVAIMRDVTRRHEQARELRRALDHLRGEAYGRQQNATIEASAVDA